MPFFGKFNRFSILESYGKKGLCHWTRPYEEWCGHYKGWRAPFSLKAFPKYLYTSSLQISACCLSLNSMDINPGITNIIKKTTWYYMVVPRLNCRLEPIWRNLLCDPRDTELYSITFHVNYVLFFHLFYGMLYWVVYMAVHFYPKPLNGQILEHKNCGK